MRNYFFQIFKVIFVAASFSLPFQLSLATDGIESAQSSTVPSTEPPSLQMEFDLFTKESILEVGGKKFRKIEYRSDTYYLQLLESEKGSGDLQIICEREGVPAFNANTTPLIVAAVKVTKRSSVFVEGLRQVCLDQQGGKKIAIDPAIRIGFLLGDDKPDTVFKNKKIFVSPFSPGVGFSADW